MSSHAVACPSCHVALRSARPLPANKKVRCPQCGAAFTTGANTLEARWQAGEPTAITTPPPASVTPPPLPPLEREERPSRSPASPRFWVPALVAGVLLLVGPIVLLVYLASSQLPAVVEVPKENPGEDEPKQRAEEKRLAEERKKLDDERRKLEQERKRLELKDWMRQGAAALKAHNYEEAITAYGEAVKLDPDDKEAVKGLVDAKTSALATSASAAKTKEDQEKHQAEVARLVEQGKEAMEKKQFAAAVTAYTTAAQLDPESSEARKGLEEARAAADADAGEKKKLADYKTHMDAGRAAMAAQRFDEAVREFQAALKLLPGDQTAQINLQTAQNRLAGLADAEKRQAAYTDLMQRAQAAQAAKRFGDAVPLLEAARKLYPDDKNTQKALKAAKVELAQAQAEYQRLLEQGDASLARRRFEEAQRLYEQAAQVLPGDPQAPAKIRAAADARNNQAAAVAAYQRFMTLGSLDMDNQRYASAARNFQEALRVVPGDTGALQGLRDARTALDRATRARADFDNLMQRGSAALQGRQYAEAVQAFSDALKIAPGDPRATRGLSQARYGRAMNQGRAALAANRPQDAARAFEDALQEVPGDPTATALLQQARARKR